MTRAETRRIEPSPIHDKLYMENTLLRVSGALFCHDAKKAPARIDEIELNRGADDKHITIRPDTRLGQPGPMAHKVFVALIKKHSAYGRPVPKEITFTKREIMRLIGRKTWGGRDSEQLSRALHEIHYTFVTAQFKASDGRFVEHSFNIFPEIWIERREFASDPIEACTITLAEPILSSLRDDHFTCLNHALMAQLGTIGQALYMRLFFHFANLYDGRSGTRLSFPKRYDDICREWLGGLTILSHRSKILSEQLGPHLNELVATGFLASFGLDKAKRGDGFVLTMRPGRLFFEDYDRFYRNRKQGGLQFVLQEERRNVSEPLQVAYLFARKRTGQPVASLAFVPSKDVETAKLFLREMPLAQIDAFIDFGLAEAARTNFAIQTLGGLKQYLAPYLAQRSRRLSGAVQRAALSAREEREHTLREAYRDYETSRAEEIAALFEDLPEDERQDISRLAAAKARGFGGSLHDHITRAHVARITAERYGRPIKTFDQWKADLAA
jgi:hypothetical protein